MAETVIRSPLRQSPRPSTPLCRKGNFVLHVPRLRFRFRSLNTTGPESSRQPNARPRSIGGCGLIRIRCPPLGMAARKAAGRSLGSPGCQPLTVLVLAALAPRCEAPHATRHFFRLNGSEIPKGPLRISRGAFWLIGPQTDRGVAPSTSAEETANRNRRVSPSRQGAFEPVGHHVRRRRQKSLCPSTRVYNHAIEVMRALASTTRQRARSVVAGHHGIVDSGATRRLLLPG